MPDEKVTGLPPPYDDPSPEQALYIAAARDWIEGNTAFRFAEYEEADPPVALPGGVQLFGEQSALQDSIKATEGTMAEFRKTKSKEDLNRYIAGNLDMSHLTNDEVMALPDYDQYYQEAEDFWFGEEFVEAREELQGYEADLASVEAQIEENAAASADYRQELKEHSVEVEALAESYGVMPDKMQEAFGNSNMELEDWLAAQEAVLQSAQEIYDRNMSGIINSLDALPREYEKTAGQILETVQGNVATKAQSIEILADFKDEYKLSDAAIAAIEAEGTGAIISVGTELEALSPEARQEFVDSLNGAFEDASELASDMTLGGEELAAAARAAGFESADEFVIAFKTGVEGANVGTEMFENMETPEIDAETFTGDMSAIADSTSNTNDSLTENTGLMNDALEGFSAKMTLTREEVSGEMETIKKNAQTLASEVQLAFEDLGTTLYTAGVNAMAGLRDGMESMRESIQTTAASLANEVPTTVKSEQQQRSPSRVMRRIGEFAGMGFALGMEDTLPEVKGAATDMADMALPILPRSPEDHSVTSSSSSSVVNNNQLSINVDGGSPMSRETLRQLKQIVRQELERILKQADEGSLVEA